MRGPDSVEDRAEEASGGHGNDGESHERHPWAGRVSSGGEQRAIDERRRHQRADVKLKVSLVIAGSPIPAVGVLEDLSESGCYFATSAQIALDRTVALSFLMKPRDLCEARGRVVRCVTGQGFGVAFETTNLSLQSLVATLLSTQPAERDATLRSLCVPSIQIGYLVGEGVPTPPPGSLQCPRCGGRSGLGETACPRCDLAFALWTPRQAAEVAPLDTRGLGLWAEAVAGWTAPGTHDAFLRHCAQAGLLGVAARHYRQRLDDVPDDAVAAAMSERVAAWAVAPIAPAPRKRAFWFWAVLAVVSLGGIAAVTVRGTSGRSSPAHSAPR
jgi:hypothetical protein